MRLNRQTGFTLIELVIVIVLMAIMSLAGIEVIRQSSESYLSMSNRQVMSNAARLSVERMSREIRTALPGSVRTNSQCVEFIPIQVAGRYFSLPVESAGTSIDVVPVATELQASVGHVAVYPVGDNPYSSASGIRSPEASFGAPDGDNVSQLSWSGSHSFPFRSPTNRFFVVDEPVSFCVDGDFLFRYQGYGYNTNQLALASLPASLPNRALLAHGVLGSVLPFQVTDPGLTRNALVEINLQFSVAGEMLQLTHEAQLRNVP